VWKTEPDRVFTIDGKEYKKSSKDEESESEEKENNKKTNTQVQKQAQQHVLQQNTQAFFNVQNQSCASHYNGLSAVTILPRYDGIT
jgi:hypothetical protein